MVKLTLFWKIEGCLRKRCEIRVPLPIPEGPTMARGVYFMRSVIGIFDIN